MKFLKSFLVFLLVFTFVASSASAEEIQFDEMPFEILDGKEAEVFIEKAKVDFKEQDMKFYKKFNLRSIKNVNVYKDKNNDYYSVQFVVKATQNQLHTFVITYDESKFFSYSELYIKADKEKGTTVTLADGEIIVDEDYSVLNSEDDTQPSEIMTMAAKKKHSSWGKAFMHCWNTSGVPAPIREGLALGCAAVCVGAAFLCIPCLTIAGGAYTGTVGYCSGYATRNS